MPSKRSPSLTNIKKDLRKEYNLNFDPTLLTYLKNASPKLKKDYKGLMKTVTDISKDVKMSETMHNRYERKQGVLQKRKQANYEKGQKIYKEIEALKKKITQLNDHDRKLKENKSDLRQHVNIFQDALINQK